MIAYIVSFAVGIGVGVTYGLLNVRSPAPPYIALLGLLGMLLGEQAVSRLRSTAPQGVGVERSEPRAVAARDDAGAGLK